MNTRQPTVSVVIVNWNGKGYIERCLDALQRQSLPPLEVIVVDNASSDGSAELVARAYPWVRLIRSKKNLGFAGGCNVGWHSARGEFVATLNPDTEPSPGWLEALVASLAGDSGVGMAASLMLFADRPAIINSAGIVLDVLGIAWDRLGGCPASRAKEPCGVLGPSGGAALYRRELLKQLGGFDETYFMYLEDVDLALRAQLRGWRCAYVPEATVLHVHSASAVEGSPFKNFLKARNRVWLLAKHFPASHLARYGLFIAAYDLAASLYLVARGDTSALRGRVRGIMGLPRVLSQRRRHKVSGDWQAVKSMMVGLESPLAIWRRFAHLGGAVQVRSS